MLRFMNPRDWHADVHIFWMWLLKENLSLISTPRYLKPPTDSRICPCNRYSLETGVLAHMIMYDNTLTWVELHVPLMSPLMDAVKILLYYLVILQVGNCQADGRAISKQLGQDMTKGTLWLFNQNQIYDASEMYYLLRAFSENLKQLSSKLTNILRFEYAFVIRVRTRRKESR